MINMHSIRHTALGKRRDLHWFDFWFWLGVGFVIVVFYQSLSPSPIKSPGFEGGDKLGHLLIYFCLMSWFVQLYQRSLHLRLLIIFIALGVLLEILQGQTGYRMFEYADMLANTLGALLAWGLAATSYQNLLLKFECWYLKNRLRRE